ncbi:MAG: hypothetical protein ACYSUY_14485, partial [Planctomycetota bacterium]
MKLSNGYKIRVVLSVLVSLVFNSPATGASFQGLGRPGTGLHDWIHAYDISADGSVVVGYANHRAFRWTEEGGLVLLESPLEGYAAVANAVSGNGRVVVGSGTIVNGCEAFRWTAEDGTVGLGHIGSYLDSRAFDVSDDGSVIVGWGQNASGYYGAFRWTTSDGMQELATGSLVSYAEGVSADGSVVVGSSVEVNSGEAFRWTESGGTVGLGDLPGGVFWSGATAVSPNGSVVVGYSNSASSGWSNEAFRWTVKDGMVGLGDLPGGDFDSTAHAVSGDGSVVVGRSVVEGSVHPFKTWAEEGFRVEAFIWDSDNAMRSLKDVLETDFGLDLTGWMLIEATAISTDGVTIVGNGINPDGYSEAWIATISEPPIEAEIVLRPKIFNPKSKGKWIECHIRLSEEYNVIDVNSASVFLEDEIGAEWIWADEQRQMVTAKFRRSDVQEILVELDEPDEVELTVSGELIDGTRFEGTDI